MGAMITFFRLFKTGIVCVFLISTYLLGSTFGKIYAPDPGNSDYFGQSVSQSGNILAVGVPQDDITYSQQGSAYLYRVEANGTNTFLTKVTAPDANNNSEYFGHSVSQSGDILAVEHMEMTMFMGFRISLFVSLGSEWDCHLSDEGDCT